jgi:hypothetical protein
MCMCGFVHTFTNSFVRLCLRIHKYFKFDTYRLCLLRVFRILRRHVYVHVFIYAHPAKKAPRCQVSPTRICNAEPNMTNQFEDISQKLLLGHDQAAIKNQLLNCLLVGLCICQNQ